MYNGYPYNYWAYIIYDSLYFDLHDKTFLDKLFICKEIFYKCLCIDYIKNLQGNSIQRKRILSY